MGKKKSVQPSRSPRKLSVCYVGVEEEAALLSDCTPFHPKAKGTLEGIRNDNFRRVNCSLSALQLSQLWVRFRQSLLRFLFEVLFSSIPFFIYFVSFSFPFSFLDKRERDQFLFALHLPPFHLARLTSYPSIFVPLSVDS